MPDEPTSVATPRPSSAESEPPAAPELEPSAVPDEVVWRAFPGPVVAPRVTSARAWVVVPTGDDWDLVRFAIAEREASSETGLLVRIGSTRYRAPHAFTLTARPGAAVVAGAPVLAFVEGDATYARVIALAGGGARVRSADRSGAEHAVALGDLLVLESTATLGAPVAWRDARSTWQVGQLVDAGAETAWVVAYGGAPLRVPRASLRVIDVTQKHRLGAAVWAAKLGTLRPARVRAGDAQLARYGVQFEEGGAPEDVGFDGVTAALE